MRYLICLIPAALLGLAACGEPQDAAVRSHLSGRLALDARIDSSSDQSGFEVLVARGGDDVDTLGYAVTDADGAFATDVVAPERGIYPLLISRGGTVLHAGELVVADADTAVVNATLPLGNRLLQVRSPENAAWLALRNTKAQYHQTLTRQLQGVGYEETAVRNAVMQTARILWSMRETFPGTVGSELAAAEAVAMVGGWDDSLAVAWAEAVPPADAGYADAASVARQATARRDGPEAALARTRAFQARATHPEDQARLQQEIVLAYKELGEPDSALAAARRLAADFPDGPFAEWASRASYELENLRPGMPAPDFTAQTIDSTTVSLQDLGGRLVLLEFYVPGSPVYLRELQTRNALGSAFPDGVLEIISVSVEQDGALTEAFLDGRAVPGRHVVLPAGLDDERARRYNVN
ncbi:MAG: redoxin domain-containing protein, partial [Rhodothermales bacterium]|nr:redoxin domain-containing protein [Rhodothermales bacterium]